MDLIEFARKYGPQDFNYENAQLEPLTGDAGFRRYYRLTSEPSLMLVNAPPEKERNLEYVQVSDFLSSHGIRVPRIYAVSLQAGAFLNEDLGDQLLQDQLCPDNFQNLYDKALSMLLQMQTIEQRPSWLQDYSPELLLEELCLFQEWFLGQLLGIDLSTSEANKIKACFSLLINSIESQPNTFVHRDFHCRNLMVLDDGHLAALDFQDAVWGPVTYDLVSLVKDCYLRWPQEEVSKTVDLYVDKLAQSGLLTSDQARGFEQMVDYMGLQRHLKVLGIFSRLNLRDGKSGYLKDLPLVLRYVLETMSKYPEFAEIYEWMLTEVVPVAEKQKWYSYWQKAGRTLEL